MLSYSSSFDEEGAVKPDNYILTKELEKCLIEDATFSMNLDVHTPLVVNFMSLLRHLLMD